MDSIKILDNTVYSLNNFVVPFHYKKHLESIIIPNGLINDRIEKMAADILKDNQGNKRIILICVLKSSFYFFNQLINHLNFIISHKEINMAVLYHFIRAKSYHNADKMEEIEIIGLDSLDDVKDNNIVIVEDIIDSGTTMSKLLKVFKNQKPKDIKIATLLQKRHSRIKHELKVDYTGFSIPDKFVVGFGMDYNQYFRDLNHLCILNEAGIEHYKQDSPVPQSTNIANNLNNL